MGILIPKPFLKFSKLKNQTKKTKKDPLKYKKPKNAIRSKKIEKLKKIDPIKSGHSNSKTILKFSKLKPNPKKTPKVP